MKNQQVILLTIKISFDEFSFLYLSIHVCKFDKIIVFLFTIELGI